MPYDDSEVKEMSPADAEVGKSQDTNKRYAYGRLLPLGVEYKKWSTETEAAKTITYEQYLKLKPSEGGQRVIFTLDGTVFSTRVKYPYRRNETRGFQMWKDVVYPSILEVIGKGDDSFKEFIARAKTGNWFVEAELVPTGRSYDYTDQATGEVKTRKQDTFKFLRMTDKFDEARKWYHDRFGDTDIEPESVMPDSAIDAAKSTWSFVKGDLAKFESFIRNSDETKDYADGLLVMAKDGRL